MKTIVVELFIALVTILASIHFWDRDVVLTVKNMLIFTNNEPIFFSIVLGIPTSFLITRINILPTAFEAARLESTNTWLKQRFILNLVYSNLTAVVATSALELANIAVNGTKYLNWLPMIVSFLLIAQDILLVQMMGQVIFLLSRKIPQILITVFLFFILSFLDFVKGRFSLLILGAPAYIPRINLMSLLYYLLLTSGLIMLLQMSSHYLFKKTAHIYDSQKIF